MTNNKSDTVENNVWLQLTITTDPQLVESITDFLIGIVGAAVEVSVEDVIESRVVNGFLEKKNVSAEEAANIERQVKEHLAELADIFNASLPKCEVLTIADKDWGSNWKKHFKPFRVIPGLTIAPTWEEYKADEDESVIVMDPGMAFGTGHHPTTAMSVLLIKEALSAQEGGKVLDVGTGTGVLGMAAVLLGADEAFGVDNDIDAVMAARENVVFNGLEEKMEVSGQNLADISGSFDIVVANIIHDVLQIMRNDLVRVMNAGGNLVLSGILSGEQVDSIVSSFTADDNLILKQKEIEGEWAALLFERVE